MIEEILFEAEEKMEKAVTFAKEDLATVRTGRATAAMFSRIAIDYYNAPTPISQLASITTPEARLAVIRPYDPSQLTVIEKAIRDSDLGVNPSNDGTVIRVAFPQLTEDRRREMVKVAKNKGEEARITIRDLRHKAKKEFERLLKASEVGEDVAARAEKELQNLTDRYSTQIDVLVKHKETELLEI